MFLWDFAGLFDLHQFSVPTEDMTGEIKSVSKDRLKRQVHILAVDCGMKNNIIRPEMARFARKDPWKYGISKHKMTSMRDAGVTPFICSEQFALC